MKIPREPINFLIFLKHMKINLGKWREMAKYFSYDFDGFQSIRIVEMEIIFSTEAFSSTAVFYAFEFNFFCLRAWRFGLSELSKFNNFEICFFFIVV
jgi:hypothetical protein